MNYVQYSMLEPDQNASECGMSFDEFISEMPTPMWIATFNNKHNECYYITTVENKLWFEQTDNDLTFLDALPANAVNFK